VPILLRVVRAGRAAARQAGKDIDFELVGGDIKLDKLLVDAIADPLIHLVRNAVDHGIESAEARIDACKRPHGTVRIEALSEGSQSRVRVTDDGRGIDPLLISEAAMRLGIADAESDLDFERSLRLIFRPGFTTLESASNVSGRGVGLDVVETAVEMVGGELRVSSKPAAGTTFEIRLPVTFGLLDAIVFVSGANRYCIPASQTLAIETVAPSNLDGGHEENSTGAASLNQREGAGAVPLVSMREVLRQPADASSEKSSTIAARESVEAGSQSHIITCQFADEQAGTSGDGTKRVGLIVDAVAGTEEVLVRTLGRHAGRWYGVAGATELRDGTVALVLDLPRLLSSAE
jgi:two-component system chemotaxis sensor kinase CheA